MPYILQGIVCFYYKYQGNRSHNKVFVAVYTDKLTRLLIFSISNIRVSPQFGCCGGVTYTDWSQNMYFNCKEDNPSRERCSVPFSCCIISKDKVLFLTDSAEKRFLLCFVLCSNLRLSVCAGSHQHHVRPGRAGFRVPQGWRTHLHQWLHRQISQLDSQQHVPPGRHCTGIGHTTGNVRPRSTDTRWDGGVSSW